MTLAQALNILALAAQYQQLYELNSPTFLDRPNGQVAVMFPVAGVFNSPEELEAYCRGYANARGVSTSQQAHAEAQESQEAAQHGGH